MEEAKYKTIAKLSEGFYKEKGSKFIGLAIRCDNEQLAKEILDDWRKQHHQARHLCYAYRFGLDKSIYRANDDGEPSNSAGAPILGQIQSFDLTNVLIGVVRYYGGTKLGVGGLINAYRTAAKDALENGEIIEVEVYNHIQIEFQYDIMPMVMEWIKKNAIESSNQVFELACSIQLALPLLSKDALIEEIGDLGEIKIKFLGEY